MKKADQQRIRELLKGKRIKGVPVVEEQSVTIGLNDGSRVTFAMEGGPGLDMGWYEWFVVKKDGATIYRG